MEPEGLLQLDGFYFLELIILSRCLETISNISTVDNFRLTHGLSLCKLCSETKTEMSAEEYRQTLYGSALYTTAQKRPNISKSKKDYFLTAHCFAK